MFDTNNIFNTLLVIPILNALVGIYKVFLIFRIPGAFGFALIAMTVLIRLVLTPLTTTQLKSAKKLSKLKPTLDKLAQQFKNDKTRLYQEQMKLYKEAGINPAAGCLPLLLQMPILIALYNLFFQILGSKDLGQMVEAVNKVIYFPLMKISSFDLSFFGMNLAHKPSEWQSQGVLLLAVPVITGLLQYWQTRLMMPPSTSPSEKKLELKNNSENKEEDMSAAMQKQMGIMMPLMIGFFAYSFPLGLSLYWNTFTIFGIIQQYQVNNDTK
jgi:YidC/Oxa1 family membrane protein insertase